LLLRRVLLRLLERVVRRSRLLAVLLTFDAVRRGRSCAVVQNLGFEIAVNGSSLGGPSAPLRLQW